MLEITISSFEILESTHIDIHIRITRRQNILDEASNVIATKYAIV